MGLDFGLCDTHAMAAPRFTNDTSYGIGIGLRVPHYQHILEKKPVVDWFEIISENYMVDAGRPLRPGDGGLARARVHKLGSGRSSQVLAPS